MAIKALPVAELKTGMLLAEPVVLEGRAVQNNGEFLTEDTLKKVLAAGQISELKVELEEGLEQDYATYEAGGFSFGKGSLEDYTQEEKKVVLENYIKVVGIVKGFFETARADGTISLEKVTEVVTKIIQELLENYTIIHAVKNLRGTDEYTYQHSVNVGVLAGIIGKWMKMDEEQLEKLVMAGVLHDVGKAKIPVSVLNKPEKLTAQEFEMMKKHPVEGYKLLAKVEGICQEVHLSAIQHHERMDGSGYPLGLNAEKIHDFAKIIAVADTYDAVTTERSYKHKSAPLVAMDILDSEMFKTMDARSCLSMIVQIRGSLQGKKVLLKSGELATITFVGKHGTDELIVKTESGKSFNIGMASYSEEIVKFIG